MRGAIGFAMALLSVGTFAQAEPMPPGAVRAIDGDTVAVRGNVVRLVGLDTPESGMRARCEAERTLASKATSRLRQLIAGGGVDLSLVRCACRASTEGTQACNYGRSCGVLRTAGKDVAAVLISEGLARPYHCERDRCPRRSSWCE